MNRVGPIVDEKLTQAFIYTIFEILPFKNNLF